VLIDIQITLSVDSSFSNVKQNRFKKFPRAKYAKLAKAPPMPPFLLDFTLAPFAFFARDTDFFRSGVDAEISVCLASF
jgi:hypothetical protein